MSTLNFSVWEKRIDKSRDNKNLSKIYRKFESKFPSKDCPEFGELSEKSSLKLHIKHRLKVELRIKIKGDVLKAFKQPEIVVKQLEECQKNSQHTVCVNKIHYSLKPEAVIDCLHTFNNCVNQNNEKKTGKRKNNILNIWRKAVLKIEK